jgi:hypothetical protein
MGIIVDNLIVSFVTPWRTQLASTWGKEMSTSGFVEVDFPSSSMHIWNDPVIFHLNLLSCAWNWEYCWPLYRIICDNYTCSVSLMNAKQKAVAMEQRLTRNTQSIPRPKFPARASLLVYRPMCRLGEGWWRRESWRGKIPILADSASRGNISSLSFLSW